MIRHFVMLVSALLAGCATDAGRRSGPADSVCGPGHTLNCDISGADRRVDPDSCYCVATGDVNRLLRRF